MTFNEYSDELRNYHFHPYDLAAIYDYFSLNQSVGALADKLKVFLESNESITPVDRQRFAISIGDIIMWSMFLLSDMGIDIDTAIELNLKKCLLMKKKLIEENQNQVNEQ